jgi:ABC-type uncharacterized transport system substrate-binding protein
MKEFLQDYVEFKRIAREMGLTETPSELIQLFSIFLKFSERASQKQIDYIKDLLKKKNIKISNGAFKKLENLTKREASAIIDLLSEG